MPITWSQADIDSLKAAIASGVKTVKYSGPPAREITYQSTEEMFKVLATMNAEVAAVNGGSYRLAATKTGLGQ